MVMASSSLFPTFRTLPSSCDTSILQKKEKRDDSVHQMQERLIANPSNSGKGQTQLKNRIQSLPEANPKKWPFWKKALIFASVGGLTIGVLKKVFSEPDICPAVVATGDYSKQYLLAEIPSKGEFGMFSVFLYLLGVFHEYESKGYGGLEINFGKGGQYYDPQYGDNWWNNYMEPIKIGESKGKCLRPQVKQYCQYAMGVEGNFQGSGKGMLWETGHDLVEKYFKIKPEIQKKIDDFFNNNLKGHYLISVHYRGTDKAVEAPRVPFEKMIELIQKHIRENNLNDFKIFAASDEQLFINHLKEQFPDKVVCTETKRSTDGKALHRNGDHPYLSGESALIDAWLLSKGTVLIRTSSNFSFFTKFINPKIQVIEASSRKGR